MATNHNHLVIMAGGIGSRFWPICKDDSPKLFIDILGTGQSLLQSTFKRFECVCPRENIIIVTNRIYVDRVREQIGGLLPYQVLGEPTRRNTAPCVAYAASVIHEMNPNANVIVTPSDHAIFGMEHVHDYSHDPKLGSDLHYYYDDGHLIAAECAHLMDSAYNTVTLPSPYLHH